MQLCKCFNCFLKAHNKQLNQYCLNFTIFFTQKKKVLKKWFGFGSGRRLGRVDLQKTRDGSQINLFLLQVKKKKNSSSSRVRKFWPVVPCLVVVVSYYGGSFVLWWIGGVGCCSSHFDLVIYGLLWLVWWLDLLSSLQSVVAGICGEERGDK